MLRALRQAWINRREREEQEAQRRCNKLICNCADETQLRVLLFAAGRCPNPVRQARMLTDLTAAFNYGA